MTGTLPPANRRRPDEIQANYSVDEMLLDPKPQTIGLVDDVLTTGAHFRAACTVIRHVYPDVQVVGLFLARRVPEAVDVVDVAHPMPIAS